MTVSGIVELPVDAGRAEFTYLNDWWHLVAVTAIGKKRVLFELGPPTEVRGGPDS